MLIIDPFRSILDFGILLWLTRYTVLLVKERPLGQEMVKDV